VYDLDGTLVDTRRDIAEAANHMRGEMGLPPMPEKKICGFVGLGLAQLVVGCLETADPAKAEEGTRIYRAYYSQHLLDHTALYPGAREVLEHFRSRRQAVITNKPDPYSRQILEGLGVAGYFFEIVVGNSGYPKKPDPESLKALMGKEGAVPSETLFVGDSSIDVETGSKAGVLTVMLAQGFSEREDLERSGPDHLVEDFRELLELAKEKSW
jgi:2-phosphoglycolate phosphatase